MISSDMPLLRASAFASLSHCAKGCSAALTIEGEVSAIAPNKAVLNNIFFMGVIVDHRAAFVKDDRSKMWASLWTAYFLCIFVWRDAFYTGQRP